MRVPYSWLREFVSVGAPGWDVGAAELAQALVRVGHEVEEVVTLGPVDGPLTVGRVTEIEELTDFKKPIRACLVAVGADEIVVLADGDVGVALGAVASVQNTLVWRRNVAATRALCWEIVTEAYCVLSILAK